VHVGKLGQVTNFTTVRDTAKPCVDQYMVLFRYCSLWGDIAMLGGLHARLCHAFIVLFEFRRFNDDLAFTNFQFNSKTVTYYVKQ